MRHGHHMGVGPWLGAGAACCLALSLAGTSLAQQVPFETVVADLKSPDIKARFSALRLLREAAYPEAALPVAALLADEREPVVLEAVNTELALFLVDRVPSRKYVAGVVEVRNRSLAQTAFLSGPGATSAERVPPQVLESLLAAMRKESGHIRFEATYAFGVLAPRSLEKGAWTPLKTGVETLVYLLKDPQAAVRGAASQVLGRLYETSERYSPANLEALNAARQGVGDQLIEGMNDKDTAVRVASIEALGSLRSERAIQSLSEHFDYYKRGQAAVAALDALTHIAHKSCLPLFRSLLKDRNDDVRRLAIEGLARVGDKLTSAEIEADLGSERSEPAMLALAFANQRTGRAPSLDRLIAALRKPALRNQARGYLLELGPTQVSATLLTYVQDSDPLTRASVADLLGELREVKAIPALSQLRQDKDKKVAAAAERSLARIGAVIPGPINPAG
jgi:HEAT repeat protein